MSDAYNQFCDAAASDIAERIAPKLLEVLQAIPSANPAMSCAQAAKYIGLSESTIRQLEESGELMRCPGIKEIRIRKSELDNYGTKSK